MKPDALNQKQKETAVVAEFEKSVFTCFTNEQIKIKKVLIMRWRVVLENFIVEITLLVVNDRVHKERKTYKIRPQPST